jgi:hypothetical protein
MRGITWRKRQELGLQVQERYQGAREPGQLHSSKKPGEGGRKLCSSSPCVRFMSTGSLSSRPSSAPPSFTSAALCVHTQIFRIPQICQPKTRVHPRTVGKALELAHSCAKGEDRRCHQRAVSSVLVQCECVACVHAARLSCRWRGAQDGADRGAEAAGAGRHRRSLQGIRRRRPSPPPRAQCRAPRASGGGVVTGVGGGQKVKSSEEEARQRRLKAMQPPVTTPPPPPSPLVLSSLPLLPAFTPCPPCLPALPASLPPCPLRRCHLPPPPLPRWRC